MNNYSVSPAGEEHPGGSSHATNEENFKSMGSAVSWGAIFAGAAGAASLSLILLLLGTGLGLSSISPWSDRGASAAAVGIAAILWLTFTQLTSSAMGGYLAGRLRTRWAGLHTDEVYFRDTAHGFLAWAVATLLTAALLTSAVSSILGAGAKAGAVVAGGATTAATAAGVSGAANAAEDSDASSGPMSYFVDSLFRKDANQSANPAGGAPAGAASASASASSGPQQDTMAITTSEVSRIFMNSLRAGSLPPEDAAYLGQAVAQRTGLSQQDAQKRVTDTFAKTQAAIDDAKTKARQAADAARKATSYASLWLVVSMLIGAFSASLSAIYGGRRRDL